MLHTDLSHKNKFYQYQIANLLPYYISIITWLIQCLQLLIFCMDHQKFEANVDYALLFFFFMISKLSFLYCLIILLHLITSFSCTRSLLVPYAYVSIESVDWILLSSFKLNAILLISSVKTCLSFWIFTVCLILIYCFLRVLYDFLRQFDFFLDFLFYLKLNCF